MDSYKEIHCPVRRFMKTLTVVVIFILLAITAGGVTGYFLYTDLVKDTATVLIQQQTEIDQLKVDNQSLRKEVIEQRVQLNKDTKNLNTIVEIFNQVLKPTEEPVAPEKPSSFDNSSTSCETIGGCFNPASGS